MAEFRSVSPLAGQAAALRDEDHGPALGELPERGYLNLRGRLRTRRLRSAAESVLGLQLPRAANTASSGERGSALWLSPDEWLVVTSARAAPALASELAAALDGIRHACNDLSGGYTTIRLQGPYARQTLSKGCTLDLDASVFAAPAVAQSLVAKAGAIVMPLPGSRGFDLIVRRSFADYLWAWLCDAAAEYEQGVGG